ncbi:hypothetical protein CBR_g3992 [Chara braunii]|uniref:Beta-glucosidase n=1 Tax=Chara braunii TaxID=69332 RepID=A0A388KH36_CHABU|nr:hypothetical protein CBR_g3992 [Chara braunii]|eukprot:GBG69293.1 hypothetical protein CBR_g3992 [Chara braunii]
MASSTAQMAMEAASVQDAIAAAMPGEEGAALEIVWMHKQQMEEIHTALVQHRPNLPADLLEEGEELVSGWDVELHADLSSQRPGLLRRTGGDASMIDSHLNTNFSTESNDIAGDDNHNINRHNNDDDNNGNNYFEVSNIVADDNNNNINISKEGQKLHGTSQDQSYDADNACVSATLVIEEAVTSREELEEGQVSCGESEILPNEEGGNGFRGGRRKLVGIKLGLGVLLGCCALTIGSCMMFWYEWVADKLVTMSSLTTPASGTLASKSSFPDSFIFGVATSAFLVEGGRQGEDGKGMSIWDRWDSFSRVPQGRSLSNQDHGGGTPLLLPTPDHYSRYKEDVALMSDMGVSAYRFSISWSRVFPDGTGRMNDAGIDFYSKLVDELIAQGIDPYVTLFDWDMPARLHDVYDGWLDDRMIEDFAVFAQTCFAALGDRVKAWITFDQPVLFAALGYGIGTHPPGRCSDRSRCGEGKSSIEPYIVIHNILRAHGAVVTLYRSNFQHHQGGRIGIYLGALWAEPMSVETPHDAAAADRYLAFTFGWLMDVLAHGDYPDQMRRQLSNRLPTFTPEEKNQLLHSFDFLGITYLASGNIESWSRSRSTLADSGINPTVLHCRAVKKDDDAPGICSSLHFHLLTVLLRTKETDIVPDPLGRPPRFLLTAAPSGLHKLLVWVKDRYSSPAIYVTVGVTGEEHSSSSSQQSAARTQLAEERASLWDIKRVQFFDNVLMSAAEAFRDGVDIRGVFAWSLLDISEQVHGFGCRSGLHHIYFEHNDRRRVPKLSAKWWGQFLRGENSPSSPK